MALSIREVQMTNNKKTEQALLNNWFQAEAVKKLAVILLFSVSLNIILGITTSIAFFTKQSPQYFAVDNQMRLLPVIPVKEPYINGQKVARWGGECIVEAFTISFSTIQRDLDKAGKCFNEDGFISYLASIEQSQLLDTIKTGVNLFTAKDGSPVVVMHALVDGVYQWQVQIPIIMTYESGKKRQHQRAIIYGIIKRIPFSEKPEGIAFAQFSLKNQ